MALDYAAGGPASATSLRVSADTASSPPKTALAALATLPVKGRAPKSGYSRAQFGPAWTDDVTVAAGHNGCDTRNDILRRDLTAVVIKPGSNGCTVLSGEHYDPYTNLVIHFNRADPNVVQIDHVVALGDAWQTGAQQLTLKLRTNFANDPLELLAVSGTANEQKGDADAASWLPPNKAFRCPFVARQVAVKVRYHLWATSAEHDAIARVLATCPSQPLPTTAGTAPPATTTRTTASASVAIVSVTSPVDSGAYARLVAQTAPHAKCDLSVTLPSGRESESSGLVTQTANATGQVEWTWLTGTRTKPGTAKATVVCGPYSATRTFVFTSYRTLPSAPTASVFGPGRRSQSISVRIPPAPAKIRAVSAWHAVGNEATATFRFGLDFACYCAWTRAGRPNLKKWVPRRRTLLGYHG